MSVGKQEVSVCDACSCIAICECSWPGPLRWWCANIEYCRVEEHRCYKSNAQRQRITESMVRRRGRRGHACMHVYIIAVMHSPWLTANRAIIAVKCCPVGRSTDVQNDGDDRPQRWPTSRCRDHAGSCPVLLQQPVPRNSPRALATDNQPVPS